MTNAAMVFHKLVEEKDGNLKQLFKSQVNNLTNYLNVLKKKDGPVMVSDTLCPVVHNFWNLDISITPLTLSQCDAKVACYASMTKDTLSPLLSKIDTTMPRLMELEEALRVKGN